PGEHARPAPQPKDQRAPHLSSRGPRTPQRLAAEPCDPPPITDAPLNSHSPNCPVPVLYQRISLLPSPLKSPVSAIVQGLAAEPGEPPPISDVPLSSHTTACPLVPLYQRTSLLPSPLKSRVPGMGQGIA